MLLSPMIRCVLIGMLIVVSGRVAQADLITNGDFEGGTYTQSFGNYTDMLPNGWSNSPPTSMSNVNAFADGSGPGSAESGTHYVAYQSAEADGSQDCLFQILNTIANQQYAISFWVAMTASPGSQFGLSPQWDALGANDTIMGTTAFYYHPTNSAAVAYTFFSFVETASSSSTYLIFHGADATGAVLLDNVSVNAVPEPGSLALALPVALLWTLSRIRRSGSRQSHGSWPA
jgi:hypothetical protein